MTDPAADLRTQILGILAAYKDSNQAFPKLLLLLASDRTAGFFTAAFNRRPNQRFSGSGGLALATITGFSPLLMFHSTAKQVYSEVSVDRMVLLYIIIMISRWADLGTGRFFYQDPGPAGAMATTAVVNALGLGVTDLTAGEVQALTRNFESHESMMRGNEPFNSEWWIMQQTMEFLFRASMA